MLLDFLDAQVFVLVVVDRCIVLVELALDYPAEKVAGSQGDLLVLMHECAEHEFANGIEMFNDEVYPQVHDGRDALDNPPLDLVVLWLILSRLLYLLSCQVALNLLSDVEKHLQVLGDVLHDWLRVRQQQQVDRVDGVGNNGLAEARRYQLANLREHVNNQSLKLDVFEEL